jgi:hypothetical protein
LEKTTPKLVICALFPKNDLLPVGFLSFVEWGESRRELGNWFFLWFWWVWVFCLG